MCRRGSKPALFAAVIEAAADRIVEPVSDTHLRAHETPLDLVCSPMLEKINPARINNYASPSQKNAAINQIKTNTNTSTQLTIINIGQLSSVTREDTTDLHITDV